MGRKGGGGVGGGVEDFFLISWMDCIREKRLPKNYISPKWQTENWTKLTNPVWTEGSCVGTLVHFLSSRQLMCQSVGWRSLYSCSKSGYTYPSPLLSLPFHVTKWCSMRCFSRHRSGVGNILPAHAHWCANLPPAVRHTIVHV